MPKLGRRDIERFTDPDDDENAPASGELEEDEKGALSIGYDLMDMERTVGKRRNPNRQRLLNDNELFDPSYDPFESYYQGADPNDLFAQLAYMRQDVSSIRDTETRQAMLDRISNLEKEMYTQYIPFLEDQLDRFGYSHSLRGRHQFGGEGMPSEDVADIFAQAKEAAKAKGLSNEERRDFEFDLSELEEKFEAYQKEPTLYTFDEEFHYLQGKTYSTSYWDRYGGVRDPSRQFGSDEARQQNRDRLHALLERASPVEQLADQMHDAKIRERCLTKIRDLVQTLEHQLLDVERPHDARSLEGIMKDYTARLRDGEELDSAILQEVTSQFEAFKEKFGANDAQTRSLEKILTRLKKAFQGDVRSEEDERFDVDPTQAGWAWKVLGLKSDATRKDAEHAFHELGFKYHPDKNKDPGAEEKFKKISGAYELIKSVLKARDLGIETIR